MKTLFTIIFTFTAIIGYSQPIKMKSYSSVLAHYYNDSWHYGIPEPCYLTFTFTKDQLSVNDRAHSIYYVSRLIYQTKWINRWEATDEGNRDCIMALYFYDGYVAIIITYDEVSFTYYCNTVI